MKRFEFPIIGAIFVILTITNCKSNQNKVDSKIVSQETIAQDADTGYVSSYFAYVEELTWKEINAMDALEKRQFYFSLTDSLPDIWRTRDVDALSYAVEDSIPSLPKDDVVCLHYRQKVNGYNVMVEYVKPYYDDIVAGQAILHFTKPGHSFVVYCNAFSDEQLIPDDDPYVKSQKAINLSKVKPGNDVYLEYAKPKPNEYLSASSPFYFKDMDFDGEDELVVNNLRMGSRGYNTYDVFKVFNVTQPMRLMGLPFAIRNGYKLTNYNVEYDSKTETVLDKRYDGIAAYGHYRYKSIEANSKKGLKRVFVLDDAEDMGFYHPKDHRASDSVNLIQPYKKYERIEGKVVITERGVYEMGNYGQNYNEIVLEKK